MKMLFDNDIYCPVCKIEKPKSDIEQALYNIFRIVNMEDILQIRTYNQLFRIYYYIFVYMTLKILYVINYNTTNLTPYDIFTMSIFDFLSIYDVLFMYLLRLLYIVRYRNIIYFGIQKFIIFLMLIYTVIEIYNLTISGINNMSNIDYNQLLLDIKYNYFNYTINLYKN